MALSVGCHPLGVVCVTCGAYSNEVVKAIFHANLSHMPARYFTFQHLLKTTSYYVRILRDSRPLKFVKIMLKFHLQTFWRNFKNGQNA